MLTELAEELFALLSFQLKAVREHPEPIVKVSELGQSFLWEHSQHTVNIDGLADQCDDLDRSLTDPQKSTLELSERVKL